MISNPPSPPRAGARRLAAPQDMLSHSLRPGWSMPLLLLLLCFPLIAGHFGAEYYVSVLSRILIYAMVATSLNLILGFGGMVSFGHAAFVGIGAYLVASLMANGIASAWLAWPAAMVLSALVALLIGAISLRTQGVYFIMITLAFAQMLYYLVISLKAWGGEDGLPLDARSDFGALLNLQDDQSFFYVVLALFLAVVLLIQRLANAEFGHVLQAIRENETRCDALGINVFRHKLMAFTVAGAIAGLAGALLANQSGFVSPSLMHWTQSGILMVMVILGGVGRVYGGVVGAAVYLVLEELLSGYTEHWQLALGALLLAVVLSAPNGILSLFGNKERP